MGGDAGKLWDGVSASLDTPPLSAIIFTTEMFVSMKVEGGPPAERQQTLAEIESQLRAFNNPSAVLVNTDGTWEPYC